MVTTALVALTRSVAVTTAPQLPNTGLLKTIITTWIVFSLVFFVVSLIAWAKILSKAGYSGWWVLIVLVPFVGPLVGVVLFFIFAFSEWPIERHLAMARHKGDGYYAPTAGPSGAPASGYPASGYRVGSYPASGYPAGGYPPTAPPPSGSPAPDVGPPGRAPRANPPSRYLPPGAMAPPPPPPPPLPPPDGDPPPPPFSGGTV
jgi:hypothetical protein